MIPKGRVVSTIPFTALIVLVPVAALAADATPAAKQAFLERQKTYLIVEITETGAKEFGAPKDALTDGAFRANRSVKFEVPLEMSMPGMYPQSSASLSPAELSEPNRFAAWTVAMPDDAALEKILTSGNADLSANPMMLPVSFSVDDVSQFRYRDTPSAGFGTQTTTSKGQGVVYAGKNGMLVCDLKTMRCDIGLPANYHDGTDMITSTTTSDVPGFETRNERVGPSMVLPGVSGDLAKKLAGFPLKLSDPEVLTFSGSGGKEDAGTTVTVKVTVSARPLPKPPAATR